MISLLFQSRRRRVCNNSNTCLLFSIFLVLLSIIALICTRVGSFLLLSQPQQRAKVVHHRSSKSSFSFILSGNSDNSCNNSVDDDFITTTKFAATTTTSELQTNIRKQERISIDSIKNIIIWKIRPCENPSYIQMLHWYICGIIDSIKVIIMAGNNNTTQEDTMQKQQYFFPSYETRHRFSFLLNLDGKKDNRNNNNNGMIVVLATIPKNINNNDKSEKVIGKFGIVTKPGPIVPLPLMTAIHRIYPNHQSDNNIEDIRVGAIIYMYIQPEYRNNSIGTIALFDIIHPLQRSCHCTYTVLVANDKTIPIKSSSSSPSSSESSSSRRSSSRGITTTKENEKKLVAWYQRHQYHIAEEIQDMMGSPNGIYGITMITSLLLYDHHHDNNNNNKAQGSRIEMEERTTIPNIQWW